MSFIFDRDFDQELAREQHHSQRDARYTEVDLADAIAAAVEIARAEAFAEGHAAGRAEALAEAEAGLEQRRAKAFETLTAELSELRAAGDSHRAALEAQVLDFAGSVGAQVFPELLRERAHRRALAQVRRGLSMGLGSVRLRVALSAEAADLLRHELEATIRDLGLTGRVDLVEDPGLQPGDARVDWDSGSLEYSFQAICDRLLGALRAAGTDRTTPQPESRH